MKSTFRICISLLVLGSLGSGLAAQPTPDLRPAFAFDIAPEECSPEAPERITATARIISRGVDERTEAEAWSMAMQAAGCVFRDATPVEIEIEEEVIDPDFSHLDLLDDRVIFAVVLSYEVPVTLPPGGSPHDVLDLELEQDPACTSCRLVYVDGLRGSTGRPVVNVVTSAQQTVRPHRGATRIACTPPTCEEPVIVTEDRDADDPVVLTRDLSSCVDMICVPFDLPPGMPVFIELEDSDPENDNALFLRAGEAATEDRHDIAAGLTGGSDVTLFIPEASPITSYLLIHSPGRSASSRVTIRVQVAELAVTEVSPVRGAEGEPLELTVLGSGFLPGDTRYRLRSTGSDPAITCDDAPDDGVICATGGDAIGARRAEVSFRLDVPPGHYDVEAFLPDGAGGADLQVAHLVDALEILPDVSSILDARLSGTDRVGRGLLSRLSLHYENKGTVGLRAPIFRLRSSEEGVLLHLERESGNAVEEIYLLGVDPVGNAGTLAAGNDHTVPILFQSASDTPCSGVDLSLDRLDANESLIEWPLLLDVDCDEGESDLPELLADHLGRTWFELQESLNLLATRLTRRGVETSSVRELFLFAIREVRGLPTTAAVGRVVSAATGRPLVEVAVSAVIGEETISLGTTDDDGALVLDGLQSDTDYELRVENRTDTLAFRTPPSGGDPFPDRFLPDLPVGDAVDRPLPECADCGPGVTFPCGPPDLSRAPFSEVGNGESKLPIEILCAVDPNDKGADDGDVPDGYPDPPTRRQRHIGGFVGAATPITYTVRFENEGNASARQVIIRDILSPYLDLDTFRPLEVQWGEHLVPLDVRGRDIHSGYHRPADLDPRRALARRRVRHPREPGRQLIVEIHAGIDDYRREAWWVFRTLDAATCDLEGNCEPVAEDQDDGFLPPNTEGCQLQDEISCPGLGYVRFEIATRADLGDVLAEGAPLPNDSTITFVSFGEEDSLQTDEWNHFFSRFLPAETPTDPSPADGEEDVSLRPTLRWETDPAERENTYSFAVFLWPEDADGDGEPDKRPDEPLIKGLREAEYTPQMSLLDGTEYLWQVVAKNRRNDETPGPEWRFTTRIQEFVRGDADGSGEINITDGIFIFNFLYLGGPAPPCMDSADTDDDQDRLNITDGIYLLNFLFLGGPPPPPPHPVCGEDPTRDDDLACGSFPPCNL